MAQCLTRGTVASFVRALCVSSTYIINKSIGRFFAFQIFLYSLYALQIFMATAKQTAMILVARPPKNYQPIKLHYKNFRQLPRKKIKKNRRQLPS